MLIKSCDHIDENDCSRWIVEINSIWFLCDFNYLSTTFVNHHYRQSFSTIPNSFAWCIFHEAKVDFIWIGACCLRIIVIQITPQMQIIEKKEGIKLSLYNWPQFNFPPKRKSFINFYHFQLNRFLFSCTSKWNTKQSFPSGWIKIVSRFNWIWIIVEWQQIPPSQSFQSDFLLFQTSQNLSKKFIKYAAFLCIISTSDIFHLARWDKKTPVVYRVFCQWSWHGIIYFCW